MTTSHDDPGHLVETFLTAFNAGDAIALDHAYEPGRSDPRVVRQRAGGRDLLSLPGQPFIVFGVELMVLAGLTGVGLFLLDRRAGHLPTRQRIARVLDVVSPNTITSALFFAAGLVLTFGLRAAGVRHGSHLRDHEGRSRAGAWRRRAICRPSCGQASRGSGSRQGSRHRPAPACPRSARLRVAGVGVGDHRTRIVARGQGLPEELVHPEPFGPGDLDPAVQRRPH